LPIEQTQSKGESPMEEQSEQRLEQRLERHETKMDYHHHTLWLRSYALQAGGWIPKVVVVIPEEEGNGERELEGDTTFVEREEADKQAFLMGKAWIDRKGAGDVSQEEISSS
jgi:hypothetical protein